MFTILLSCSPQSKESYLEEYQEFIHNVRNNCENYSAEDWLKTNEKFIKFSKDWNKNFEEDFTWEENILLSKFKVEYNVLKFKNEFSAITEIFKKEDFEKLRQQIKYYSENEMEKDLEFIINQSKEIGGEAAKTVEEILKELEMNVE